MFKVLFIAFVWPEPCSSAAGSRSMELLRVFRQQGWSVVVASAAALSTHRADLRELDISEHSIAINSDSFDHFVNDYQPDMVVFDRFFTEEQFGWRVERQCPQALRVLDTCDLHSLREIRQRFWQEQQAKIPTANEKQKQQLDPIFPSYQELIDAMRSDDVAQREIAAIYRCDLSLLISSFEMALLQNEFGLPDFLLCQSNLMLVASALKRPRFTERQHFISIGNFRHAPNWDAVLWLKHAIWPRLHQRLPQAQLHIYGAYPPPKAMNLHNPAQSLHVLGWVDDAQKVMAQARVCLAPLRFGAGLKGKLADAMACGTPSVTTVIGSEGMSGSLPWAGAVANSSEEIIEAAAHLYQEEAAWQQAQVCGDQILRQYFQREQAWQDLLAALSEARAQQS